jgi:hypothetical protein
MNACRLLGDAHARWMLAGCWDASNPLLQLKIELQENTTKLQPTGH